MPVPTRALSKWIVAVYDPLSLSPPSQRPAAAPQRSESWQPTITATDHGLRRSLSTWS